MPDGAAATAAQAAPPARRLLFIANSLPCPPRDGVELPSSRILEHLARSHRVDLLVLGGRDAVGHPRERQLPAGVRVLRATPAARGGMRRIAAEALGRDPAYFATSFSGPDLPEVLGTTYDAAWVSPVSELGFVRFARRLGSPLARVVALGLNDATTTLYTESFRELLTGRVGFTLTRLLRGLRAPSVLRHESRYLREVHLVHVQTEVEARRVRAIAGATRAPRIVVAPNGRKEELRAVRYGGADTARVLYMTHLDGARAGESRWFLSRVWPRVRAAVPGAELWLAGSPPDPGTPLAEGRVPGVRVLGYVPDLASVYDQVAVAVVPIFHGTGLINRLQDAITAGIPTVTMPRAAATIEGLVPARHALTASTADDFLGQLVRLLQDTAARHAMAAECRALAEQLPTWDTSLGRISAALRAIQ